MSELPADRYRIPRWKDDDIAEEEPVEFTNYYKLVKQDDIPDWIRDRYIEWEKEAENISPEATEAVRAFASWLISRSQPDRDVHHRPVDAENL